MKMKLTVFFLLLTMVIIPFVAWSYGIHLSDLQAFSLISISKIVLIIAIASFIISELSWNFSQVDKLWSIVPILYTWYFAWQNQFEPRSVIMGVLVSLWGIRLTYNFARKGGYHIIPWKGEEDYRWSVLQKMPFLKNRFRWSVFNLFFISIYQHSLIFLITFPALAVIGENKSLNWIDMLAAGLMLLFIVLETIADQQQYNFQSEKYRQIAEGNELKGDYALGFRTTGLFGLVRHPNYTSELAIWLSFYLFSVAALGQWINWSITGAILLILLFYGSSSFSEKISSDKYPEYQDYQNKIPRFIPVPFKK